MERQYADRLTRRQQRRDDRATVPDDGDRIAGIREVSLGGGSRVRNVERSTFEHCAAGETAAGHRCSRYVRSVPIGSRAALLCGPIERLRREGDRNEKVALASMNHPHLGIAEASHAHDERIKHRLQVRRRRRDRAQDIGGGGLLLQRLGDLAVALLEILEEAGVFDGDDRLIGKRLKQRDLLLGVGMQPVVADDQHAERLAFAQERHGDLGALAQRLERLDGVRILLLHDGRDVWNVDGPSLQVGAAGHRQPRDRRALEAGGAGVLHDLDRAAGAGGGAEVAVLDALDGGAVGLGEPECRRRNRFEYPHLVSRGGGDDAQHLGEGRLLVQGVGDLAVARLKLGEKAGVLGAQTGVLRLERFEGGGRVVLRHVSGLRPATRRPARRRPARPGAPRRAAHRASTPPSGSPSRPSRSGAAAPPRSGLSP